jgi:branched-chain amino acid transport system permease protein
MRTRRSVIGTLVFFAALALVPVFTSNSYILHIFTLAMIYLVAVAGWDLIMGYGGVFSFGQVAFFVFGAYGAGIMTTQLGLSPWLAMLIGGLLAAVAGVGIALPSLRVTGEYVALVTYALHLLMPTLIIQGEFLGTGGTWGLWGVPTLSIGGYSFNLLDKVPWFYVALAIALLCIFGIYYFILRSSFGLALTALRDSESFAGSLGINRHRTTLWLFAASAFVTGVAGGYYVFYTAAVSQRLLGLDFFLILIVMLTVGGMGRYPGVLIGTFAFAIGSEYLRIAAEWRMVIMGSIIIFAILLMPGGLVQLPETLRALYRSIRSKGHDQTKAAGPEPADP